MIWNEELADIVKGYKEDAEQYQCVYCNQCYVKGRIYSVEDQMYDAYGAVKEHIRSEHGLTVDYLLSQECSLTGISEVQGQILRLMSEGKSDREIAAEIGIAQSTVRNHRFKLREKEKQSRLFLALMESLEQKTQNRIDESDHGVIEEIHRAATMIDDRYSITEQERRKTLATYMDKNGAIRQFPAKEKKKIILLTEVMKNFKTGTVYTEAEINRVLKRIYKEDYVAIRRALIEYGYMDRSDDCRNYRVKE